MDNYSDVGDRLVREGLISTDDLRKVARIRAEQHAPLVRLFVELGFISEEDLLPVLSSHFGIPYVTLKDYPVAAFPVDALTAAVEFLKFARLAPLKMEGEQLLVATTDPMDLSALHALGVATGLKIQPVLAREKEIGTRIDALFSQANSADLAPGLAPSALGGTVPDEDDVEHLRDMASEVPVIRLVNQTLARALESRASDVHIEPFEDQLKVRYRIDGLLHEVESPPRQLKAAIISRLKILAQLNIAERRLPQDGRIKVRIAGKDVDLRISTVPTLYGESLVIRLLERSQISTDLGTLGFPDDVLEYFGSMITKPHGLVLVTGPTGSGKTTTLYGALSKINDPAKKIITIEDPVEYQLTRVNQIQVKPQIGLTFANGLRSIVRQDPDIIMVGEIRDFETAEIAVQAALTGHLVLSTLHTNDASGAISRLLEMGVQDYLLASSLLGVLAQRLVRRLCHGCRKAVLLDKAAPNPVSEVRNGEAPVRAWEAVGCDECASTGYIGRIGIFELLKATPEICNLIVQRREASAIRALAQTQGMRMLREDGWEKARVGVTTLAEVLRVTREEG
jgi:general secretion pathway protein E